MEKGKRDKKNRFGWTEGLKIAKRRYSKKEAESFYKAMRSLYKTLLKEKPDLVIWPLRGTWSFVKILRLIANSEKKSSKLPEFCMPKIGQVHDKNGLKEGKLRGERSLNLQEKLRILQDSIVKHQKAISKKSPKIFLVDEVYTGGAIFKNHQLLKTVLDRIGVRNPRINTVAIEHKGKKRKNYEKMAREIGMKRLKVKKLFTVDKLQYMYPMTRKKPREGKPELMYNKKTFKGTQQLMEDIYQIHRKKLNKPRRRK